MSGQAKPSETREERGADNMASYDGRRVKVVKSERFPDAIGVTGRACIAGGRGGFMSYTDPISMQPFPEPPFYRVEADKPSDRTRIERCDFSEDDLELLG